MQEAHGLMIQSKDAYLTEQSYRENYQQSLTQPEAFWAKQAKTFITWFEEWEKVLEGGFDLLDVTWYAGGKLNAAYNCLDRHLENLSEHHAIIWEGDNGESKRITYHELHRDVCRFANVLKADGVSRGDRVCIYMPMVAEAVVAMLACARIGAIHSVVFGGFSAEALTTRILDADCRWVITANESVRGGKLIPLKESVDQALLACPEVKTVFVVKRTETKTAWQEGRDVWYHEAIDGANADCPPAIMDANDPLFILYTSGSTGKPKGILHTTGGYLVYAAMTHHYIFNYQVGETYWCTADIGWITGHTYNVYGPLCNGATILLFEGVPNYPDPSRYWEIIDKHQVNIFYTAPTAIRALRREGDSWVKKTSRKSLKLLGTVGEPINPDAWDWYFQVVGDSRCPVVDTWWQTETGGIMISAIPYVTPLKPGSAAWPFFGVAPLIVNDEGEKVPNNAMGKLVITQPWPGIMKTIYGNPERFKNAYFQEFPNWYLTGDQANCDSDGYYWIDGRSDDVIKVSGHRIGSQEVESALVKHPAVSEAAVVAIPDAIKGHAIYAFVTLKTGLQPNEVLHQELLKTVKTAIGAIAVPDYIQWTENLPKTRSGKIMRRILKKIANKETTDLGDLSTLADPSIVETLINQRA